MDVPRVHAANLSFAAGCQRNVADVGSLAIFRASTVSCPPLALSPAPSLAVLGGLVALSGPKRRGGQGCAIGVSKWVGRRSSCRLRGEGPFWTPRNHKQKLFVDML